MSKWGKKSNRNVVKTTDTNRFDAVGTIQVAVSFSAVTCVDAVRCCK